jgi:uncharacterized protein YjcR
MSNFWSDKNKAELYKLYLQEGPKWVKLAELLKTTPDAVRNCFRRTDWTAYDDKVKTNFIPQVNLNEKDKKTIVKYWDGLFNTDESKASSVNDDAKKMIQERKDRITRDTDTRKLNEHLSQIAKEEMIYDKIVSAITQIPPITTNDITDPYINKKHMISPQEAFLLISDVHVGLAVIPEEVGGIGNYNVDTFKKRLKNLIDTVCHITDLHRTNHKMDTLNIGF